MSCTGCIQTASDWTKQFISQLLHLTHGQWIYRNISRYHYKHGLLWNTERKKLVVEIDSIMALDPSQVPEESGFLLEIYFQDIKMASTKKQSYWVHAVWAAVKVGPRVAKYKHHRIHKEELAQDPAAPLHIYGDEDNWSKAEVHLSQWTRSVHEGAGLIDDS